MKRVAFDVDGTLIQKDEFGLDVPRWTIIQLLMSLQAVGVDVYLWSGGGIQYAQHWREKLGLDVKVLVKEKTDFIDICLDDEEVDLARVNIQV